MLDIDFKDYKFAFDKEKQIWLKKERDIDIEHLIALIKQGEYLDFITHPRQDRYPNQKVFLIGIEGYVHFIPVIIEDKTIFIKTVFASRQATKQWRRNNA